MLMIPYAVSYTDLFLINSLPIDFLRFGVFIDALVTLKNFAGHMNVWGAIPFSSWASCVAFIAFDTVKENLELFIFS